MLAVRNAQRERYYAKSRTGMKRPWTPAELSVIMTHSLPDSVLAGVLNRSVAGIQAARKRQKALPL